MKNKKSKKDVILLCICSLFIVLGYKRITIGALLFISLFYIIVKIKFANSTKMYNYVNMMLIGATTFYAFISAFGVSVFKSISDIFGIDFMGRIQIMEYFQNSFNWRDILVGRGFMFSDNFLNLSSEVNHYAAIHNDILRVFIDVGFVGFVIFFVYTTIYLHRKLSMGNKDVMLFNEMILMYLLMHYTTDNLMIYPRFFAMLCLIMVYYAQETEKITFAQMFKFDFQKSKRF